MESWTGHLPITTNVLLSLFERAAVGDCDFSQDERVLFSASEFWAASVANELSGHLGSDPVMRLHDAGVAFSQIGASTLSDSIFRAINELYAASIENREVECVSRIEHTLQTTRDPVDLLIARFAERCVSPAGRSRRPGLRLVSGPEDIL